MLAIRTQADTVLPALVGNPVPLEPSFTSEGPSFIQNYLLETREEVPHPGVPLRKKEGFSALLLISDQLAG
jgi:hypothetical protein